MNPLLILEQFHNKKIQPLWNRAYKKAIIIILKFIILAVE